MLHNINSFMDEDGQDSFCSLVDQFGEDLMRLAYTYVKDHSVAEDMVQDVFLRAFEKRNDFRGQSSCKTYLYRITINRCHDYLRSWTYKNVMISEKIFALFQSSDKVEAQVIRNHENHMIGKKVFSLPVKYREVLVLHYYKDMSVEEVADILDCSESTVKTRLKRGREKLKQKLLEEGEGILDESANQRRD
ncbi:MAG TPA: sigma-70 family RNA polymerase sigma factor [Bacillaceae bacterium]